MIVTILFCFFVVNLCKSNEGIDLSWRNRENKKKEGREFTWWVEASVAPKTMRKGRGGGGEEKQTIFLAAIKMPSNEANG